jgi:hypothetical protein
MSVGLFVRDSVTLFQEHLKYNYQGQQCLKKIQTNPRVRIERRTFCTWFQKN